MNAGSASIGSEAARRFNMAPVLVGDIGGTNARLALVEFTPMHETRIVVERTFPCADFPSFEAVIDAFFYGIGKERRPSILVAAVAGPVMNGAVAFTNLGWRVTESGLVALGFERVRLINDFIALALAIPELSASDVCVLGEPVTGQPDGAVAVIGAGTGFGAAGFVRDDSHPASFASEGGHMSFAPCDETEIEILRVLSRRYAHVSVERVLSGPGLVNLYRALSAIKGEAPDQRLNGAPAIVAAAAAGDMGAQEAVERFCLIFGSVAGDFALAYGARGGVFLAGGIAPKLVAMLRKDGFRKRFETKGRMTDYLKKIPTKVIMRDAVALLGAARVAAGLVPGAAQPMQAGTN